MLDYQAVLLFKDILHKQIMFYNRPCTRLETNRKTDIDLPFVASLARAIQVSLSVLWNVSYFIVINGMSNIGS